MPEADKDITKLIHAYRIYEIINRTIKEGNSHTVKELSDRISCGFL